MHKKDEGMKSKPGVITWKLPAAEQVRFDVFL